MDIEDASTRIDELISFFREFRETGFEDSMKEAENLALEKTNQLGLGRSSSARAGVDWGSGGVDGEWPASMGEWRRPGLDLGGEKEESGLDRDRYSTIPYSDIITYDPVVHRRINSSRGKLAKRREKMAYVERGVVKEKRSIWRLSIISDFFLAIYSIIKLFFLTMFSMDKTNEYKKGSGSGKKWDGGPGGGPGGRGPYGGGGGGSGPRGPRTLRDIQSADHSSLPACGSCCG
ncbi:hypothetical protein LUZ60_011456 [Juncus effusus]|nr:hypothetical protein LUZ60_011456 [Juncus effusus]